MGSQSKFAKLIGMQGSRKIPRMKGALRLYLLKCIYLYNVKEIVGYLYRWTFLPLITYLSCAPQGFEFLYVGEDEIDGREVIHTHEGEDDQVSDIDGSHLTETGKLKSQYTMDQCNGERHILTVLRCNAWVIVNFTLQRSDTFKLRGEYYVGL